MEIRSVPQFLQYWDNLRTRTRRVAACIPPERLEWTRREGAFTAGRPSRYPGLGVPTPPLFGLTAEEVRARSSGT